MKKNDIVVTPSISRSLRKNYSITPILKKFTSTTTTTTTQPKTKLKPILKSPPVSSTVYHGIQSITETWSPSQKKSVSTPVLSHTSLKPTEKRVASLQTIKQKFMIKEQPLPWEQYITPVTVNCQKSSDYDDMIQELNISHALVVASNFKTMSFVDADKLYQKFQHLKTVIESMYGTLRVQTDTTRATVMTLKLDAPQNKQFCQLNECAIKIDRLLDEFYFTSKYANHLESTYLQNLAGTLAHQKEDNQLLINFLSRLENILYDNNQITSNSLDIQEQIDSVIEKLTQHFKLDSKNSDTMEELTKQRERSASLVLELEKNRTQRLIVSEKKENLLKSQLMQETSQRQILQDRVTDLENTIEIKDRTLSNFAIEIEEFKIKMYENELKINKLQQELKRKESMTDIEQLEDEKIKWSGIKKNIKSQCSAIVGNQDCTIEEVVQLVVQNYKKGQFQLQEMKQSLEQLEEEKRNWIQSQNLILNQCYHVMDIIIPEKEQDLPLVMQQLIQQFLTTKEELRKNSLQCQESIVLLENQALLETNLKYEVLLKSKQSELVELELQYKNTIKTYTTRESAYILQSASTEAELERILKEYDRLTRNIIDFNHERKKFESEIRDLQIEKLNLSKELSIEQVQNIHGNDRNLRKEFRDLMAIVKEQHVKELIKLVDDKRKVEQELREKMSEIEMKRWEKVDISVQTNIF